MTTHGLILLTSARNLIPECAIADMDSVVVDTVRYFANIK